MLHVLYGEIRGTPNKQSVETRQIRLLDYLRKMHQMCLSTSASQHTAGRLSSHPKYKLCQLKSCWPAWFVGTGMLHRQQLHRQG